MSIAFVLVHVEAGTEKDTIIELKQLERVEEIYELYEPYDIIVKVVAENEAKLKELVSDRIRKMDSIYSMGTMIVIES